MINFQQNVCRAPLITYSPDKEICFSIPTLCAKIYGCLRELLLNFDLGSHEESKNPTRALKRNMKTQGGTRSSKKGNGWKKTALILGTPAYTVSNQIPKPSINSIWKLRNNPRAKTNYIKPSLCSNCGYTWSTSHRQNCPAREKICKNCGITNHFAKNLSR